MVFLALSHLFNQGYVSAKSYAEFTSKYAEANNVHIPDVTNHLSTNLIMLWFTTLYLMISHKID
jgi:hypothetical protein